MSSVAYVCPKGHERHHKAGVCHKHKIPLERRCAHCDNKPEHCICN